VGVVLHASFFTQSWVAQGGGGRGRIDRGALADARLDAPLPWDHIDTGIAKWWLKADLQRALEALTVDDCSHNECSECGVCGDEFGDNVVVEPPPIPEFEVGAQRTSCFFESLNIHSLGLVSDSRIFFEILINEEEQRETLVRIFLRVSDNLFCD
jgi:hypothetical protein